MSTGLRLGEFATTPLYNIKAVVQATNISPSTLRAWERRYQVARPQRSESGYRLYSERDIAVIRWLKAQIDAGMSISHAVTWLGKLTAEADAIEQTVLPTAEMRGPLHSSLSKKHGSRRERPREKARTFESLQRELLHALTGYEEEQAETLLSEAFSLYPLEQVGEHLILATLLEISERREQGHLGITVEHYASNFLMQRLTVLLRATPNGADGPLLWVGSACNYLHEASALLLTLCLRRAGYRVHYLGRSLPTDEASLKDLANEARHHQPALMLFSASTINAAVNAPVEPGDKPGQYPTRNGHGTDFPDFISYSCPLHSREQQSYAIVHFGSYAKEVVENVSELLDESHVAKKQRQVSKSW